MTKLKLHAQQIATFATLSNYLAARPASPLYADWRADAFGEEYVWRMRNWHKGERVLDAGCGYSLLPRELMRVHGVEAWGADDFGEGPMPHWKRNQDVQRFIKTCEGVRYVFELLGDATASTLPRRYFDVIYSKFAIHFSPPPHAPIWRHMEMLLSEKAGSELVVLVPHVFITNGVPASALERLRQVSEIETDVERRLRAGELPSERYWADVETYWPLRHTSPYLYCAYICSVLGIHETLPDDALKVEQFCLNPSYLIDPPYRGLMAALYSRNAQEMVDFDPGRYTPVVYRLERTA